MTPPVFIHQYEKIRDLLKFLQAHKSHIAIVIDEYGGTLGIVTMEDILEELVGEIWDEHDEVVESFKKLEDNVYLVDCLVNLEDFKEFFDLDFESDSVSLGGWVMEQMERIPQKGESFRYEALTVTVAELDARRVSFVRVEQDETPEENNREE